MKRKPKVQLIKVACRRCEKELYTLSRSIIGADRTREKYAGICSECTTSKEFEKMSLEMGKEAFQKQ